MSGTTGTSDHPTRFGRYFALTAEVLLVVLSVLERSRIVRFLSAKVTLDLVVEVTDRFGAEAGHRLSTVIAAVIAEPMIIPAAVAGILVIINFIVLIAGHASKRRRRKKFVSDYR